MINPKHKLWQWGPIDGCMQLIFTPGFATACQSWRVCGYGWPEGVFFLEYPAIVYFAEEKKLITHGKYFINDILIPSRKKHRYLANYRKAHACLTQVCRGNQMSAAAAGDKAFDAYERFRAAYQEWWAWGIMIELANIAFETMVEEIFSKKSELSGADGELRPLLTMPDRPSFYREEEIALHTLACRWGTMSVPQRKRLLSRHAKCYQWLLNSYLCARVLDEEYFEKRIIDCRKKGVRKLRKKTDEMRREHAKLLKKKKACIRALDFSKSDQRILSLVGEFAYLQDERKKFQFMATHTLRMLLEEIERCVAMPLENLNFLAPYEVRELRKRSAHARMWRLIDYRRRSLIVAHLSRRGISFLTGKRAHALKQSFFGSAASDSACLFTGLVVSKGAKRIRGTVRILTSSAFIHRLADGEILVTPMTAPDYVVAMRRASAIITDHGGMTCHAAVVSRELKKPCIVGTKVATKVLKDGDMIEVDATAGTIRKI